MKRLDRCFTRLACAAMLGTSAAVAADAPSPAAAYESGAETGPLRQLEQQVREAAGDEAKRAACEAALLPLLAPDSTLEAKRFACGTLSVIGTDASLPALRRLLKSEETVGLACLALGGMRTAKAGDALRAALAEARGGARLPFVTALGYRAEAASAAPLAALAGDADSALACASVRALGAIDEPGAHEAVKALRRACPPALVEAVGAASLRGAEHGFRAGERAAAVSVCEELLAPTWPENIRRGALGVLLRSDAGGSVQRVRGVLSAETPDPALAAVAIAHVPELRGEGVSKAFGELLPRLPTAQRVLMVEALAARGDAAARLALREQAVSEDPAVRCAAINAIGGLEGTGAVDALAKALATGPTPEERKAAQAALAGLGGGEETDRALIGALRGAKGEGRLALLSVLSVRGGRVCVAELLAQACATDEAVVRASAQGLVRVAGNGDAAALAVLREAVSGGDARAQEAALRALAAWRGLDAWETLAEVYEKMGDGPLRALALRGLARLAGEANARPDAALVGRYRRVLAGARRAEERKLILGVLGGATHPDALALALPLLDDPAVRPQAVEVVARLAKALAVSHPEMSREALMRLPAPSADATGTDKR